MKHIISIFFTILTFGLTAQSVYLNYDGQNDFINVADNVAYDFSGDFTVELKFKRDSINLRGDLFVKKDLNSIAQSSNAISIFIQSDNKIWFWLRETTSSTPVYIVSTTTISSTNWVHIACKRTGSTIELYVDGVMQSTGTMSSDLTSNGPIRIGSNRVESLNPLSPASFPFEGNIDEVRIWNTSRSSSDIQSNMNNELLGTEIGLIGYFNFNHGVDCSVNTGVTTLLDGSPTSNNGTLYNFDLTGVGVTPCESNWNGGISTDVSNTLLSDNRIVFYPNPTTGSINIDLGETLMKSTITITNNLGQKILTKSFGTTDFIHLDFNAPQGIYFLQIQSGKGQVITKKIIKN